MALGSVLWTEKKWHDAGIDRTMDDSGQSAGLYRFVPSGLVGLGEVFHGHNLSWCGEVPWQSSTRSAAISETPEPRFQSGHHQQLQMLQCLFVCSLIIIESSWFFIVFICFYMFLLLGSTANLFPEVSVENLPAFLFLVNVRRATPGSWPILRHAIDCSKSKHLIF